MLYERVYTYRIMVDTAKLPSVAIVTIPIYWLGRSPSGGHGNPVQYSCLENPKGLEEPGGLQPMGSQTVGHNYVTKYSTRYDSSYLSIFMSKLRVFHHLGFYKSTSNERYQSET